ncbi:Predicted oxidoreductase [Mucilaginibacter mallensis]|uniref:Predicted oxidoreductase n=1 Tax=Mucilaginibacter mallensis TaxID=652787 RepID=A0A1H2CDD6_MUCMA|nr:aldo/keto reductase [Mucilaginibacter mallensis]SDT68508.1 Predicted oxidoreductase [Mucilaginibacter mallensis]
MKYKMLGDTGLLVSQFCLGTMTFGDHPVYKELGGLDQVQANTLVKQAVDAGINFIDTANVYSAGRSEEITGQAIKDLGFQRDSLVIATKARSAMGQGPNDKGLSRKHLMQQVDASLKRLGTDYIDLYQMHSYDALTPIEETLRVMDDLVRSGKVRYIGASNVPAWLLSQALTYSKYNHVEKFISLQAYYTIAGRDLERELVPLLQAQKVGLMVWSPLAGGLLSGKYSRSGEADAGRRNTVNFPPVNRDRAFDILDVLHPMAELKGVTVAQLSLAWLLHQPVVTSIIVGAKKPEQLSDNLNAAGVKFSEDELKQLDEISKLPAEYPGWILEYTKADRTLS